MQIIRDAAATSTLDCDLEQIVILPAGDRIQPLLLGAGGVRVMQGDVLAWLKAVEKLGRGTLCPQGEDFHVGGFAGDALAARLQ
ncbi:hypothetical protein D3C76_1603470 [compost metagenome]